MLVIIVLFVGRIYYKNLSDINIFTLLRKPFSRDLIDKPNVLALELRDDESLLTTNSTVRHVW